MCESVDEATNKRYLLYLKENEPNNFTFKVKWYKIKKKKNNLRFATCSESNL